MNQMEIFMFVIGIISPRRRSPSPRRQSPTAGRGPNPFTFRRVMKRGVLTPLRYRRISSIPSLERPRRTESRNPLICHNCGEAGHRSTSCRRPAVSCGNCGSLGHRQLFCMNNERRTTTICRQRAKARRT